jgi:type I restriction enzyme R subunit
VIGITESAVEEAVLEWFEGLGYAVAHGPDIAVDGSKAERSSYADVLLVGRLRTDWAGTLAAMGDEPLPKLLPREIRVRAAGMAVEKVA